MNHDRNSSELEQFIDGYCETMVWAGLDWSIMDESGNPAPLDRNYSVDNIAESARAEIQAECIQYLAHIVAESGPTIGALLEELIGSGDIEYTWADAGGDFLLTRNGHGAGYWDRGLGEIGETLTDIAHMFGETNEYVDGGKIYV